MKNRGLIPTQLGLSERINPQGYYKVMWNKMVQDQIDRDDMLAWARREEERELREEQCEVSRWDLLGQFRALLP